MVTNCNQLKMKSPKDGKRYKTDVANTEQLFPDEFTESRYTKNLRGAFAKAKANAAQNRYLATAVVRIKDGKLYLYDIINIKKEASTPL